MGAVGFTSTMPLLYGTLRDLAPITFLFVSFISMRVLEPFADDRCFSSLLCDYLTSQRWDILTLPCSGHCLPTAVVRCNTRKMLDTDESTHSFVLALNNDFTGGGTYFYDHDTTVIPAMGQVLSFAGGEVHHGGEAVTSGQRYILAGFLCCDSDVKQQTESLSSSDNSSVIIEASLNHEAGQRKRGENASITSIKVSEGFRECKQQKTNAFSFGFAVDQ